MGLLGVRCVYDKASVVAKCRVDSSASLIPDFVISRLIGLVTSQFLANLIGADVGKAVLLRQRLEHLSFAASRQADADNNPFSRAFSLGRCLLFKYLSYSTLDYVPNLSQ